MGECFSFSAEAKDRIVIQSPTETGDSYGGRSVSFANVGTYWARVTPVSGRELFAQSTTQSRASHKILIRYQAGFKDITAISDYRVSFDDRYFAINAIRNLDSALKNEGKEYQELLVEENGPDTQG